MRPVTSSEPLLATGDLNFDGYREIIIGAPGNGRIYVILGGPGLSGTIDLSVTAPIRTYSAPGIGSVLTSGDVTGDNIYDVVAGAPSQNLTYIFAGGESIPAAPMRPSQASTPATKPARRSGSSISTPTDSGIS